MRKPFVEAVLRHVKPVTSVFMTGDLGFMALEPVREAFGGRFINAGVAEQNMISVAAGLAKTGLEVWAYSIAPFCYARPFEQIRNDVCLHRLPVHLVGNGGGYGYGVMGSTHRMGCSMVITRDRCFRIAADASSCRSREPSSACCKGVPHDPRRATKSDEDAVGRLRRINNLGRVFNGAVSTCRPPA